MESKTKNILILVLFFGITIYVSSFYHELAHYLIFKYYGVPAKIRPSFFGWYTIGHTKGMNHSYYYDMEKLHLINEIVGYNLIFVFSPLYLGILLIVAELLKINNIVKKIREDARCQKQ